VFFDAMLVAGIVDACGHSATTW